MNEIDAKHARINALLEQTDLNGVVLRLPSSVAWATGGVVSDVVGHDGSAPNGTRTSLFITPRRSVLITMDGNRLSEGDAANAWARHWEIVTPAQQSVEDTLALQTRGLRIGADCPYPGAVDLKGEIQELRAWLTPEDGERFRQLGRRCAAAVEEAVYSVRPGQTEIEIAASIARASERQGVRAVVDLVAADDFSFPFRDPEPSTRAVERYAMLVLCGQRDGLICSLTRSVCFGRLPTDLRQKSEAVAQVDAAFLAATRPGRTLGQVFADGVAAFGRVGYPDEWRSHHQGGTAGYEPREYLAGLDSPQVIRPGQAFSWNPMVAGAKSEDTVLLGETGGPEDVEILTAIDGWPTCQVEVNGENWLRPAILEIT